MDCAYCNQPFKDDDQVVIVKEDMGHGEMDYICHSEVCYPMWMTYIWEPFNMIRILEMMDTDVMH